MIFRFPPYCLLIMIGLSCADSPRQKSTEPINNEQQAGKINKPTGNFPDTLTIHAPAAVFYNPDSLQLEKIKKIIQKNEFESEVHNCFYLVRNAQIVLKKDWPQVHIIETSRNRWLLFIKDDKSHTLIDLDNKGDMCGLFLFDGKKEPELADMMNIDTALGFYFSK